MKQTLDFTCYLVIGAKMGNGGILTYKKPSIRACTLKPATASNEVALELSMSVPTALFQRPQIRAKIAVPPENAPFVIDCDIQHRIAEQLRETLGCDLQISVGAPEEEAK